MSHPSSSTDDHSEWHVLLRGERLGPLSRDALRTLLATHPDGWHASVWRLGMLDWRAAESVSLLKAEAFASEALLVGAGALADPVRVVPAASRDSAGELRVLSYGERQELARELSAHMAPAPPSTPNPQATGEWAAVGTSELRAIGTSELRVLSAPESGPAETSEWAAVGTSELRAIGTSELRVQTTISELRAVKAPELLHQPALPSVIVSIETASELPSFSFRAERDEPSPARGAATPTPRAVPMYSPARPSQRPSRAPLFVMGSLIVLSALALGTALTLRWLRAPERTASYEHAAARAPSPPRTVQQPAQASVVAPPVAALPAAAEAPALDPVPVAHEPTPAEPALSSAMGTAKHSRAVERGADNRAARRVQTARVTAAWANVRVSNDGAAQVLCSLPRGTVRSVLTELPGTEARWFAVRCDAKAVGWVHENDLAPLAR